MTDVLSFRIAGQRLLGLILSSWKLSHDDPPNTDLTLWKHAKTVIWAEVNFHKFSTPVLNSRWVVSMTLRPLCSWDKGNFTCSGKCAAGSAKTCDLSRDQTPVVHPIVSHYWQTWETLLWLMHRGYKIFILYTVSPLTFQRFNPLT